MRKSGIASLLIAACLAGNAVAGLVFVVEESGANLTIAASGSLSLSGTTFTQTQTNGAWNSGLTYIRPRTVTTGTTNFDGYTSSSSFTTDGGALTTQVFPSGPAYLAASSATGDYVAFQLGGPQPLTYVPAGYTSNSPVNATATYAGQSLASLGMTASTVWKWYLGANGDESQSITVMAVPEPAAYVIAFAGVAGGSLLMRRRKSS